MLAHRRRHWTNIEPALSQLLVFAANSLLMLHCSKKQRKMKVMFRKIYDFFRASFYVIYPSVAYLPDTLPPPWTQWTVSDCQSQKTVAQPPANEMNRALGHLCAHVG